jgi:YaaC-like Protein
MGSIKIPIFGSFQAGRTYSKGDPHAAAWKFIKRIGTIDNLRRIAEASRTSTSIAEVASLRIRQAIELHEAANNTSTLTRPLLLYYCALNLVRGALLARHGEAGAATHGMRYKAGQNLLACTAEISKAGTFPKLMESIWGGHAESAKNQIISLKDVLSQVPELRHEFHLIGIATSSVAEVHIDAFTNAPTTLKYFAPGVDINSFEKNWQSLFPWMADKCRHCGEMTLALTTSLHTTEALQQFCNTHLWRDLQPRQSPVWFDQIAHPSSVLLPRVASYLAGLFILSNVSRYEPEVLMPAVEPTNLAFVVESFLDCAERSIPLLVIELLEGPIYFE